MKNDRGETRESRGTDEEIALLLPIVLSCVTLLSLCLCQLSVSACLSVSVSVSLHVSVFNPSHLRPVLRIHSVEVQQKGGQPVFIIFFKEKISERREISERYVERRKINIEI